MNTKILLLALSAVVLGSCSTAYKSGQTPDDVYYSPLRPVEEKKEKEDDTRRQDEATRYERRDYQISMSVRDRRWRDFDDDYDYRYSPYNYCYCKCSGYNYGYYYNPYYYRWPVYIPKYVPVNSTPRMVNLNAYRGISTHIVNPDPKSGNNVNWVSPSGRYNNSNSNAGNNRRQVITPSNNNSNSNNTRTYTPSSNNNSSSGSSNNSSSNNSSNNSGSVSRPNRGG